MKDRKVKLPQEFVAVYRMYLAVYQINDRLFPFNDRYCRVLFASLKRRTGIARP